MIWDWIWVDRPRNLVPSLRRMKQSMCLVFPCFYSHKYDLWWTHTREQEHVRVLTEWIVHIPVSEYLTISAQEKKRILLHIFFEYFSLFVSYHALDIIGKWVKWKSNFLSMSTLALPRFSLSLVSQRGVSPTKEISISQIPSLEKIIVDKVWEVLRRNLDGYFSDILDDPETLKKILDASIAERREEINRLYIDKNIAEIESICRQIVRRAISALRPKKYGVRIRAK